jgi:dienelactone hydrolase
MKSFPKSFKLLSLPIIFCGLLAFSSCSDDDGYFDSEIREIVINSSTRDTIIYIPVHHVRVPVYLSVPKDCDANSPLPAVVVLHGSGGMWKDDNPETLTMTSQFREWKELLDNNCMVGAFVDSFSGRGATEKSGKWETAPDNFKISSQFIRSRDANAAMSQLRKLKFKDGSPVVRSEDIGLLGFSDGGTSVISTLYDTNTTPTGWEWTQSFGGKEYDTSSGVMSPEPRPLQGFSGGVFYYGGSGGYNYWGSSPCNSEALEKNIYQNYAPILFQIPTGDSLSEGSLCLAGLLAEKGKSVELNIYEGVGHGFDTDDNTQSSKARTKTLNWLKNILHMN